MRGGTLASMEIVIFFMAFGLVCTTVQGIVGDDTVVTEEDEAFLVQE